MFVSAIQLNLKHCFSKKQFISYIEKQVFEKMIIVPDIVCFPENINYCLLFSKKEKITSLSIKTSFENIFDKFISKLDLSFIFRFVLKCMSIFSSYFFVISVCVFPFMAIIYFIMCILFFFMPKD